jgi:CubicO group peptidase (beta-lactamase class C family)
MPLPITINRRLILAATLLLLAGAGGALPAAAQTDWAALERVAQEELTSTGVPGAALAVVVGDRVVFARGFGTVSAETAERVTADTLFRMASTTKMFTAAAALTLAEQGKLRLDAPVGEVAAGLDPRFARVTVHQLLTHTAGLRDEVRRDGSQDDSALLTSIRAWEDEVAFMDPGEIYSYSNPGYMLAGLAVQEAAGQPFADAMAKLLFEPLGMRRSTFRPTMAMTYPFSLGHVAEGGSPVVVRPYTDDASGWPAGSMISSVNELSRFAIAFLNGGRLEGRQVLSTDLIAKLAAPHVQPPTREEGQTYGYGVEIGMHRGVRMISHAGSRIGFSSDIRMAPEQRVAVIMLANRNSVRMPRTVERALEMALPLQPAERRVRPVPVDLSAAQLQQYVGEYVHPPMRAQVELRIGGLVLREGRRERQLTPLGNHRFHATEEGRSELVTFLPGPDGRPRYLHRAQRAFRRAE